VTTFIWSQNHQTPICEINPMEGSRQVPIVVFSRSVSRTHFTHPGVRETVPETEFFGIGTQTGTQQKYALPRAYRQQVRSEVRTSGSHPLTRGWREPERKVTSAVTTNGYRFGRLPNVRLPRWLPPKADTLRDP
jgi:hypothetical protein